jgi:predicted alpha-1,2-mannosidase
MAKGPGEFGCFFAAELSPAILDCTVGATAGQPPAHSEPPAQACWLRLQRPADGRVTVRIATSFISGEQAWLNLRRELGGASFEETRAAAQAAWDRQLGVVGIEGADDARHRTFYSCLYRSQLYPRVTHEYDANGRQRHFSFFDGRVHDGPLCTDIGLWDAHRTHLPLLAMIAPDRLGEIIRGWVNTFKEGGWLPGWASPGYIPCMVGSHAGLVIADAYAKGIRDFDAAAAYAAIRQDAMQEPPSAAAGRPGLARYAALGWVPDDEIDHAAARTCDYALADFGAAQLARQLGFDEDAARFRHRALSYRHLYDPQAGFLRGRRADGSWPQPFREFAWTRDYIEGGAWQHTWSAPHDAAGLISLFGGEDAFVAKLERMLALPPRYEVGRYPEVIHEMTEMAAVPFGQYAHSNEPVHHVLHLFTAAGRPDLAQHWIRRVLNELYSPTSFCGDEDNGAMGSWYVLNALGLHPLTPGHPAWVLGAPLFSAVTLRLAGGGTFVIRAEAAAADACHVAEVRLNGRSWGSLELPHTAITPGGELTFVMTADPRIARRRGRLPRPYSLSATATPSFG